MIPWSVSSLLIVYTDVIHFSQILINGGMYNE
jgi:hypothetical protein